MKKSEGWRTDVEEMYTTKWYTASKLKIKIENLATIPPNIHIWSKIRKDFLSMYVLAYLTVFNVTNQNKLAKENCP
ncbi:hypothetical protein ACFX13_008485 [Malus domestica]